MRYVLLVACFSLPLGLHAQAKTTDSLEVVRLISALDNQLYSSENHTKALDILQLAEKVNFIEGILFAKKRIGFYYEYKEELEKAIFTFHDIIKLAEAEGYTSFLGDAYLGLGNIYLLMEEYEISTSYFRKAINLSQQLEDQELYALSLIGYGLIHSSQGLHQQALDTLQKVKQLIIQLENKGTRGSVNKNSVLSNIANEYVELGKVEEGLIYFKEALSVTKELNDSLSLSTNYADLAFAYSKLGVFNKAFVYYDSSLYYSNYFKQAETTYWTYSEMSTVYYMKGDTGKSLEYYEKYHQLEKETIGREARRQITELEFKFETAEQDKELLQAQKDLIDLKLWRHRMWIFVGLLLIGLLVGMLSFLRLKENVKRKQELHATETALIESQLKNKELEAQQLQQNLDNKQSDLTNLALDIARKNEFSTQLINQLAALQKTPSENINSKLREITLFAGSHLRINEDLAQFQNNIEAINQEFYQKLDKEFSKLSINDKYLCGLIRLNLSNKEIAAIRGISTNSAKVNRYRLRKKLGLDSGVDIVGFLQQF